jgi:leucyl aminopeptidase
VNYTCRLIARATNISTSERALPANELMPSTHARAPHKLNVTLAAEAMNVAPRDIIALCVFGANARAAELCQADDTTLEVVRRLISEGDFKGDEGESLLIHASAHAHARRLLLIGMDARGDDTRLSDGDDARNPRRCDEDARSVRRAAAAAVRRATEAKAQRLFFILPALDDAATIARAAAEGAILGSYANDFYQSVDQEDEGSNIEFVIVADGKGEGVRAHLLEEIERGRVVAESVNWARTLADEPGASLPPREFARRASEMAAEFGLRVESLNAEEIRARGMGGLWGVGQGSDEPPALIVVRYEPEGVSEVEDGDELFAFVGKGITFDTGGISIKPAQGMEEMKSDMAGGAAALGALRAIAQLKPRARIVAIVPTAENMPSGKSLKPGDVVRTYAGYTVEVVDTDAEGRLVLIDGIAYARSLGATRIVDLATLTGSIIVALGDYRTGLFSNDDEWASRAERAAARAGEPVWRMPVSDDYKKKIESDIADFKNYAGRPDAIAAALLLSKFADATPWVHLDIAATAWLEEANDHAPAGATGTGVRTLVELVLGDGG